MKKIFIMAACVATFYSCSDKAGESTASGKDTASSMGKLDDEESREERNKETALACVRAIEKGNADVVLKDMDKDGIDYGEGSMPPFKGIDSSKKMLSTWMAAIPDYKGTDFTAVADGDYVMVYGTWTGTWKNDLMGMKATNKSFKVKDVDIFKFNEAGKIVEHRSVQSNSVAGMQLGMPMEEPKK
jgi:predicted ester cyclase